MNKNYLFEFNFTLYNINSHLVEWCKKNEIDYINGHLGNLYADIYGIGRYYYLHVQHVAGDIFEVYASYEDYIDYNGQFERMYELKERAVTVSRPTRKIRLLFEKEEPVMTDVNMPSLEIRDSVVGRLYTVRNSARKVVDIQIVA